MKLSSCIRVVALSSTLVVAVALSGCSTGSTTGGGAEEIVLNPDDFTTEILTKSPTGVVPASLEDVTTSDEECEEARAGGFTVGISMHVMSNSVPQLQVAGITDVLEACGVAITGVTDANFSSTQQTADIENMIQQKPDGIISVPTDGTAMGPAYSKVEEAGIRLILSDIFVAGLEAGSGYTSLVGSDIRAAGQIAGAIAAAYVPEDGTMGFVDFGIDFFATNERTAGAQEWVSENRPDIEQKVAEFTDPAKVEQVAGDFLTANPSVAALYTVWDAPGQQVLSAQRGQGLTVPTTTVDLGTEVALELAQGGLIKGIGAQLPYEEGQAQGYTMLRALLGQDVPEYVVTPALPVLPANLLEAWEAVWHSAPPAEIVEACKTNAHCG